MNKTKPDSRVRSTLLPSRVIWQAGDVVDAERLLRNDTGQATVHAVSGCTMRGDGASVLIDFGRELHGGVQLVVGPTKGWGPVSFRLRFGESVSEAMSDAPGHHSMRDLRVTMPSMASQEFGQTGFRFARIDADGELPLVACRAVTLMRDLPRIGSFRCSDERLDRIWEVGADTVHLCLQDHVWDGIKRDRAVWIGDLHPEAAVVNAVWGDLDVVRDSLDFARDHSPLPEWMNGIGSYSMWWVVSHRDWFLAHGDRAYLEAQRSYLTALLPVMAEQIREDGTVEFRGWAFLDWPSSENKVAVHSGLCALLSMALRAGQELLDVLGETTLAAGADAAARRIKTPAIPEENKQASALLALAGLHDPCEVNSRSLSRDPLRGLSTFYGYYVLRARALDGDIAGGLDVIRRYWGAMLDLGATSFWEHFDLAWAENAGRIDELPVAGTRDVHADYGEHCYKGHRHSLCHGWAAGPTAWLSEFILGVRPIEPGCRRVLIRPNLGDLAWAEGTYPTPRGVIRVRHESDGAGRVKSEIDAPPGVEVERRA